MRYIRYAFWAVVAICLITVGVANRDPVSLRVLPDALADFTGISPSVELPLFMAIFFGVALGLLIGFLWEWVREYKHRSEATRKRREAKVLEREVARLKAEKNEGKDEVLALLD